MTVNVNINILGCPYAGAPFMKGKDMEVNIKTTRLENSDNNIKGLATMTIGNAFKVQSISIVEGKNGLFVSMPSYKSKHQNEQGNDVFKDICNPITREFREDMNKAILDSFGSGEEKSFGTPDGKDFPDYKVKVTPLANSGNTVGIAKIYFGDDFVVSNISIKKTGECKLFASMPSFKTSQVDENGKPVYKDIAFPSTKEFNNQLQKDILIAYHEAVRGKERDSKSIQDRLSEGQSKSADTLVSGMNDRSMADSVRDTVLA